MLGLIYSKQRLPQKFTGESGQLYFEGESVNVWIVQGSSKQLALLENIHVMFGKLITGIELLIKKMIYKAALFIKGLIVNVT